MKIPQLSAIEPSALRTLPSITALLAFERTARHLSFRKAAKDLGLSPSAISHQIRGLEERFGVSLFHRTTRTIRLSPAGTRYLQTVTEALEQLQEAGRELLGEGLGVRGELRVSALPFFTSTVILPALSSLAQHQPGLTLRLDATHQYADFESAGVDVAIRFGREHSAGLKFESLVEVRSQPVCTPNIAASITQPSSLKAATLIHVSAQPKAWHTWLRAIGEPDLVPRADLWVDTVSAALEAAEHGLGVALGMHPLIRGRPGFGQTLVAPFPPSGTANAFHMVIKRERATDRRIIAFREWLKLAVARVVEL